jgi:hypothetical protein
MAAQRLTATKHPRFTSRRTNVQHTLDRFATTDFLYMSERDNSPARKLQRSHESKFAAAGRAIISFEHSSWLNHADTYRDGQLKVKQTTFKIVLMEKLSSGKKIKNTLPFRSRAYAVQTINCDL